MKFSACTDMINWGKDFFEGVELIRNGDIEAVEFWNWANKDIDKIKKYVDEKKIVVPGFCLSSSDEEIAALCLENLMSAGMEKEFMHALEESVETAKKLGAKFLIATVGDFVKGLTYEEQIQNIKRLVLKGMKILKDNNIILMLEPICRNERPGYLIPEAEEMLNIIKELDSENVKLLYDIFHQYNTGDYSLDFISENIDYIGHIHISDVSDRSEPKERDVQLKKLLIL